MTILTITPFARSLQRAQNGKSRVTYSRQSPYRVETQGDYRLQTVIQTIEHMVAQHRQHKGPNAVSFCSWKGSTNREADFLEAHALMLDYRVEQFEELREAADRLRYARIWFTGETGDQRTNTITMVLPFSKPANKAQVERIACCVTKELDVYGLIDGALSAATHLAHVHATTLTAYERGELIDPEAFITRTAKQYQERDALKYHAANRPAAAPKAEAIWVTDDMFAWPETSTQKKVRDADEVLAELGVTLR